MRIPQYITKGTCLRFLDLRQKVTYRSRKQVLVVMYCGICMSHYCVDCNKEHWNGWRQNPDHSFAGLETTLQ